MAQVLPAQAAVPRKLHYEQVPETKHECKPRIPSNKLKRKNLWQWMVVDWAELATLDLSKFDTPGGKEDLAKQLFNAIQQIGMCEL